MATRKAAQDASELVVLAILAEGPRYGYAISKLVQSRSDGALSLGPGVLYPLLRRLEKEGLIEAAWETVKSDRTEESDGRRRKWYTISRKGERRLEQRINAHRAHVALVEAFIGRAEGGATGETA